MTTEKKDKLTIQKAIELKFSAMKIIKYYFPEKSAEECDYILWEETIFPFDNEIMMDQIYELYINSLQLPATP